MHLLLRAKTRKLLLLAAKIGLGSALAILIAEGLRLQSATAAGTIALLTLSSTRTQTAKLIAQRFATYFVSISLCWVLFGLLHSEYLAFALFLVLIVFLLGLTDTMPTLSVNAMIGMHVLSNDITIQFFWNELALMCIGTGIAFLFSHIHPLRNEEMQLRQAITKLDADMETALHELSCILSQKQKAGSYFEKIEQLEDYAGKWKVLASEYRENSWKSGSSIYEKMLDLRVEQFAVLHSLKSQEVLLETRYGSSTELQAILDAAAAQCRQSCVPTKIWQMMEYRRLELSFDPPCPVPDADQFNQIPGQDNRKISDPDSSRIPNRELAMIEYQILMDLKEMLLLKENLLGSLSADEAKVHAAILESCSM